MNTRKVLAYGARNLFFAVAILLTMAFVACKPDPEPAITYTVQANGTADTADSTAITFTFSASVDSLNLTAADIVVGGAAAKAGALTGSGKSWTLPITVSEEGIAKVTIAKDDIDTKEKNVVVHKAGPGQTAITYTAEQDGGVNGTIDSTGIKFTFSASVDSLNLTAANITVTGAASKGSAILTGSGTSWTLAPITVNTAGLATVSINKSGIETAQQTVTVYQAGQVAPETVTITWNFNGGTPGAGAQHPTQIVKGMYLDEPYPDPTKANSTFGGWYSDPGLTQPYYYFSYAAVTADLNLYAKWVQTIITYTATQSGGVDGTTTTTGIKFTFSASVDSLNLTAAEITVTGAASKGSATLSGSGTSWTLAPITVNTADMATVSINKTGIDTAQRSVLVYQAGQTAVVPEYFDFLGEWLMTGAHNNWEPEPGKGYGYNETITLSADQFKLDSTYEGEYLYLNISSWTKIDSANLTVSTPGMGTTTYAEGWTLSLYGGTTKGYSPAENYATMNLYMLNEYGTAQIRRSTGGGATVIARVYVKQ